MIGKLIDIHNLEHEIVNIFYPSVLTFVLGAQEPSP